MKRKLSKIDKKFQEWCNKQVGCCSMGCKPCVQCKKAFEAGCLLEQDSKVPKSPFKNGACGKLDMRKE